MHVYSMFTLWYTHGALIDNTQHMDFRIGLFIAGTDHVLVI